MTTIINASTSSGLVNSADTSGILQLQTASTAALTIDANQRTAFVAGTAALPAITTDGDTNTGIFFPAADTIAFSEGGAESMRIDSSGNVGIGVTPSATSSGKAVEIGTVGNTLWGIGAADLQISAGTYYNGANKYAVTGSAVSAYELVAGSHRWYYAASGTAGNTATFSERMRIDSSGNLLVGTTSESPGYGNTNTGVQIGGTNLVSTFSRSQTDFVIVCNQNTVDGSNYYQMVFRVSNVTKGSIISSSTATAYNTSSDYRLKENIAPMTGALAKVAQLKPVTYKWKEDGSDGEGFIAHELAEVCPQAVSGEKDAVDENGDIKPQGIDVSFLVATLTAAIQELKAINDTQAETINALTARIVALETK